MPRTSAEMREWNRLRKEVWERDKGICIVCRQECEPEDWHLGHIVDRAMKGKDEADNLGVMCKWCNKVKPPHKNRAEYDAWIASGHWHASFRNYLLNNPVYSLAFSKADVDAIMSALEGKTELETALAQLVASHPNL